MRGRTLPSSNRSRRARALAVVFLLLPGTACILVVKDDPDTLDTRCHFAGDDSTTCGRCIVANCQKRVDACCASTACRSDGEFQLIKPLQLLDQCATGFSTSCEPPTFSTASSTDGAMFSCIQSSCAAACANGFGFLDAGGFGKDTGTASTTSCSGTSSSCFCTANGSPNAKRCDTSTVPNALCCASSGWPSSGTCTCETYGCRETSSTSCSCSAGSPGTSTTCSGTYCCRSFSSCRCSTTPCSNPGEEVSYCTVAQQECTSSSATKVTACSSGF